MKYSELIANLWTLRREFGASGLRLLGIEASGIAGVLISFAIKASNSRSSNVHADGYNGAKTKSPERVAGALRRFVADGRAKPRT